MRKLLGWIALFMLGTSLPLRAAIVFVDTHRTSDPYVVNGSFEKGLDPGISANLTAVDATTIKGWTVESGTVDYIGTRWVARDGKRCLDLTGLSAGTIFQNVSGFRVGQHYRLSFLIAANPEGGGGMKTLQASIAGKEEIFSFDGTGFNPEHMGWSVRTLDFVAHSKVLRLTFTGLDDGLYGPALDRVRITRLLSPPRAAPAPEP
jgi:choice-of-anchor C domain-containing protein